MTPLPSLLLLECDSVSPIFNPLVSSRFVKSVTLVVPGFGFPFSFTPVGPVPFPDLFRLQSTAYPDGSRFRFFTVLGRDRLR